MEKEITENMDNVTSDGKKGKRLDIIGIILVAVPAVILAGVNSWFQTCGPMEDGSFMACHWAGRTVAASAVMMLAIALIRLFARDRKMKAGLDIALAAASVFTALVPGRIISLCMMEDMMCRAHTQPWTIGLSILLLVVALADIFFKMSAASSEKHRRY